MRLTDITIKSIKSPAKGAVIYWDDQLPGFGVRVSQAGAKSFVLTHARTRTRETIGRAGIIDLKDVRAEAKRRLAEYTLGKNKPCSVAWNVAIAEYLTEMKRELRPRSHFPARGTEAPFNGFSKFKEKLDRDSGVKDWVLHDLTRTVASGLASVGVQLPVVERLWNHVSGSFSGIVAVYQRYDFFPQMQDAMTRWEEHVQKLIQN